MITQECSWARDLALSEQTMAAMTDDELRDLLAHRESFARWCASAR